LKNIDSIDTEAKEFCKAVNYVLELLRKGTPPNQAINHASVHYNFFRPDIKCVLYKRYGVSLSAMNN